MLGSIHTTPREKAALLAMQIGAVAVVLIALPYKAFDLDRYFVPKELVLHACAAGSALLLIGALRRVTMNVIDVLLMAFLAVSVISSAFAINLWAAERALAISFSGAALFWSASALRRAGLVRPLLVAVTLAVVVGAGASLAQAYGVESEYFSLNRIPGGTFGNRNFVAHLCAIGLPVVVLVALTARSGFGSMLGALGMAIVAAALVLSRSRAAWLAVIVLFIPVAILALLTWRRWCERRTLRRLIGLGFTAGMGVLAAVFLPNRLEWKSDSPYLESASGLVNYKEGSGRGRLVQYTNSLHMTAAHPLLGVGPGNWPVAYPKYASRNDPSMSQQDGVTSNPWPSSDWIAFLSERGTVGFALLILVMAGLFWRALADLRRGGRDAERILTAIALVGTLIAAAVVGAFDAVLLIAVPTFFVWTLAGALAPPSDEGVIVERRLHTIGLFTVLVMGTVAIGRSAFELAAMAVFSSTSRASLLERASDFDPGNYRIHTRLAQAYLARRDCRRALPHARAARALYPNAGEPRRLVASCGGR